MDHALPHTAHPGGNLPSSVTPDILRNEVTSQTTVSVNELNNGLSMYSRRETAESDQTKQSCLSACAFLFPQTPCKLIHYYISLIQWSYLVQWVHLLLVCDLQMHPYQAAFRWSEIYLTPAKAFTCVLKHRSSKANAPNTSCSTTHQLQILLKMNWLPSRRSTEVRWQF